MESSVDLLKGYSPLHPSFDQEFVNYQITLFDLVGRELLQTNQSATVRQVMNQGRLSPGIYTWKVTGQLQTGKFIQYSGKLRLLR